ncbi:MAG TPA: error-prone DNA polymerase [Pinirhizobacter sp.]
MKGQMAGNDDVVPSYAELHALSDFSFQRGASSARELFDRARSLRYQALAITDECSLAGIVRAWEAAKGGDCRLIVGSEIRLHDGPVLVLLVEDHAGYSALCQLITRGRRAAPKGEYRLGMTDMKGIGEGLCVLWAPGPLHRGDAAQHEAHGAWVASTFPGRAWLAVELHRGPDDDAELEALRTLGQHHGLPCVAAGDVHMHIRQRRALHDVLTAIRINTPVAEAGHALFPNGERHLRRREVLGRIYPPDLLAESTRIAARCLFRMDALNYVYPRELVPEGSTPARHLRELTQTHMGNRWPNGVPPAMAATIERELALIAELKYEAFFLTVYDIVRFARSKDILCQGRGSAANSVVCYCLGITEVDPANAGLLFERFISAERNEPPDIDVDFEHERREEVIQYIYGKYGRERAALAATVITYRSKSAARDVGRALGLSEDQLDQLSHAYSHAHGEVDIGVRLRERGFDTSSRTIRQLVALVEELRGMPRHLSQHVGGFVIADQPLYSLVPVENATMDDRTVIQWDKDDLESMRLLKVDCLALGMLTCLRKTLDLLRDHRGIHYQRLADIPIGDKATYRMIRAADTIGVFQIESRAQMSMLPRLKPKDYYDLVVQVAIVRPGPIQGGMVHPYLKRRSGEEKPDYPSDKVREVLERTLGVPIFQEQVMRLLMVAADFTAGEADHLRRSMAAWKRHGGLEHFEQRIFEGFAKNNYSQEFAARIFSQIQGFGSYGFPESHAAGFALLAYISSYIKCHHPEVFTCALLNSQPMGFYAPAQLVQDLRRQGFEVRPSDVTASTWDCSLEPVHARDGGHPKAELALRLGMRMIAGLSSDVAQRVSDARAQAPFSNLDDLCRRAALSRSERERLADAGALRMLSGHRHRARWESAGIERDLPMLGTTGEERAILRPPTVAENVFADYATHGLSLTAHPLSLVRGQLRRRRACVASQLPSMEHGRWIRHAGLVTVRQRPETASGVTFLTLEDETGQVNVVVRRDIAERQREVFLGAVLMAVDGELQAVEGVRHLIARRLHDYGDLLPGFGPVSRDFH